VDVRDPRARLIVETLPAPGETVPIDPEEAAHARARRLAAGDPVILLDGSGREAAAQVVRLTRREVFVQVSAIRPAERRRPRPALFVAAVRADRISWIVEKATELGAARVTLVESGRTQSFRASARLLPKLERVAREAAKQCGRAEWPGVSGPISFARSLEEVADHRLLLDLDGDRFPERLAPTSAALLVGPEGGWTEAEKDTASRRGWAVVRLPAGKLRAETAAIAGLVLLRAAFERFR
jgi:16S rRNA (uracil1498-N3)-methyltransferase